MKLTARTEVAAPRPHVFSALSDIPALEEMARERGAEVTRLDDGRNGPAGAQWRLTVPLQGRPRAATARVAAYEPEDRIALDVEIEGIAAALELTLASPAPDRTLLGADVDIRARTLSGRLLVQPLKLARGNLEDRLRRRLEAFGARVAAGSAADPAPRS